MNRNSAKRILHTMGAIAVIASLWMGMPSAWAQTEPATNSTTPSASAGVQEASSDFSKMQSMIPKLMYADFVSEAKLSPEQEKAFFQLLDEHTKRATEKLQNVLPKLPKIRDMKDIEKMSPEDLKKWADDLKQRAADAKQRAVDTKKLTEKVQQLAADPAMAEVQKENAAEMKALLGEPNYIKFHAHTLASVEMQAIGMCLEAAKLPLEPAQRKAMLVALRENRHHPATWGDSGGSQLQRTNLTPEALKQIENENRQILAKCKAVLTTQQYPILEQVLTQEQVLAREFTNPEAIGKMLEMLKGGGGVPGHE